MRGTGRAAGMNAVVVAVAVVVFRGRVGYPIAPRTLSVKSSTLPGWKRYPFTPSLTRLGIPPAAAPTGGTSDAISG